MQSIVDIDSSLSSSGGSVGRGADYERLSLETYGVEILTGAIQYALFGSHECSSKFTCPIIYDSIPRPFADSWLATQRETWLNRDKELISASLWKLLKQLVSKIGWGSSRKFFFDPDKPSVCDVYLYSYLSVLLSIPDKFVPYPFLRDGVEDDEVEEVVHRIKTFLLDFDDWLWQLSSKRANEHATKLIVSASKAAKGAFPNSLSERTDEEIGNSPTADNRPFLGKDTEARKSNLLFLGAAGAAMVGVGYLSSTSS
jgi:hypothetical protein